MTEDQDVKRWLHSALADEPPLSIDRDEIYRQGKRKLRNRKLFQAGGTVTGVVAAAVGAVLLTGLVDGDDSIPPASSPTATYPPSSAPPVSTTTPVAPPSSEVAPPSVSTVDGRAARFTTALRESGVLPVDATLVAWPGESGEVTFRRLHENVYQLRADVNTPKDDGAMSILIEQVDGKGMGPTCQIPETPFVTCQIRTEYGVEMTVAKQKLADGEIRRFVRAVRPDGSFVTVTSTNLAEYLRLEGKGAPYERPPPLTEDTLIELAVLPAFGAR